MISDRHGTRFARSTLLLLSVALSASCASGARDSPRTTEPAPRGYAEADVRFVQGMIHHHAQALVMTDLVPARTENEVLHRLARRIEISQWDEIARMERWLEAREEELPGEHVHGPLMPGMLTEDELARLAGATGPEFDRLFLELMIHHHEGALVMVRELASTGGSRDPEFFQLVSHIDADQRAEIARMRGISGTPPRGGNE